MKLPLRLALLSASALVPLFACAKRGPDDHPPPPPPSATASASVAPTADDFPGAADKGWKKPEVVRDARGRVASVRFQEVTRATYLENDAWRAHVTGFVAAFGGAFGYGAIGAPGKSYSTSDQGEPGPSRAHLGVVVYPSAERCPGLEVGLVYTKEEGDVGVPKEWVVHCAEDAAGTIGDNVKTPGEWVSGAIMAKDAADDPFMAWLSENEYAGLRMYDKGRGRARIVFEETPSTNDPIGLTRALAKKAIALRGLPPLDREVVVRSKEKGSTTILRVELSATSNPLTARMIAPSLTVELSEPYQGKQSVQEITLDAEEEPKGPRPPRDDARTLPPSFASSPEVLYFCNTSGGNSARDDSLLVDRRGDVYEFFGSPRSYATEDILRALRRGKRYVGTLDPSDVTTLAKAPSSAKVTKRAGEVTMADAPTQGCFVFRRGRSPGMLAAIPTAPTENGGEVAVPTQEVEAVLSRMAKLREKARSR